MSKRDQEKKRRRSKRLARRRNSGQPQVPSSAPALIRELEQLIKLPRPTSFAGGCDPSLNRPDVIKFEFATFATKQEPAAANFGCWRRRPAKGSWETCPTGPTTGSSRNSSTTVSPEIPGIPWMLSWPRPARAFRRPPPSNCACGKPRRSAFLKWARSRMTRRSFTPGTRFEVFVSGRRCGLAHSGPSAGAGAGDAAARRLAAGSHCLGRMSRRGPGSPARRQRCLLHRPRRGTGPARLGCGEISPESPAPGLTPRRPSLISLSQKA